MQGYYFYCLIFRKAATQSIISRDWDFTKLGIGGLDKVCFPTFNVYGNNLLHSTGTKQNIKLHTIKKLRSVANTVWLQPSHFRGDLQFISTHHNYHHTAKRKVDEKTEKKNVGQGVLSDLIPTSQSQSDRKCLADSKENLYLDLWSQGVHATCSQHLFPIKCLITVCFAFLPPGNAVHMYFQSFCSFANRNSLTSLEELLPRGFFPQKSLTNQVRIPRASDVISKRMMKFLLTISALNH